MTHLYAIQHPNPSPRPDSCRCRGRVQVAGRDVSTWGIRLYVAVPRQRIVLAGGAVPHRAVTSSSLPSPARVSVRERRPHSDRWFVGRECFGVGERLLTAPGHVSTQALALSSPRCLDLSRPEWRSRIPVHVSHVGESLVQGRTGRACDSPDRDRVAYSGEAHPAILVHVRLDVGQEGADPDEGQSEGVVLVHSATDRIAAVLPSGLGEPAALAADMLGRQNAAEFLEPGRRIDHRANERLAFVDLEAEHLDVACEGVADPVLQVFVIDTASELENKTVGHRNAGQEHTFDPTSSAAGRLVARWDVAT